MLHNFCGTKFYGALKYIFFQKGFLLEPKFDFNNFIEIF